VCTSPESIITNAVYSTNGTIELDTITNRAPCYTAGSRILTLRGEVPVQELPVGDLAAGVLRPRVRTVPRRSDDRLPSR